MLVSERSGVLGVFSRSLFEADFASDCTKRETTTDFYGFTSKRFGRIVVKKW